MGANRCCTFFGLLLMVMMTSPGVLSPVEASVSLIQRLTPDGDIVLRCTVEHAEVATSIIRLGCSLHETGICRENCTEPCLIVEGEPRCQHRGLTSIYDCKYTRTSDWSVEVEYTINRTQSGRDSTWWCTYRGVDSESFRMAHLDAPTTGLGLDAETGDTGRIDGATKLISPRRRGNSQLQADIHHSRGHSFLAEYFPPKTLFIIFICTVISCFTNVIFCIRCMLVRKQLRKLADGGRPNWRLEGCLCMQSLSKFYKKRSVKLLHQPQINGQSPALGSRKQLVLLQNSNPQLSPVVYLQERTSNTNQNFFISGQTSMSEVNIGDPQGINDTIYDDLNIPQSSIDLDKQSLSYTICDNLTGTPQSARRCVIAQDGTLYVAMGKVSASPSTMHQSRSTIWRQSQAKLPPRSPGTARFAHRNRTLNSRGSVASVHNNGTRQEPSTSKTDLQTAINLRQNLLEHSLLNARKKSQPDCTILDPSNLSTQHPEAGNVTVSAQRGQPKLVSSLARVKTSHPMEDLESTFIEDDPDEITFEFPDFPPKASPLDGHKESRGQFQMKTNYRVAMTTEQ